MKAQATRNTTFAQYAAKRARRRQARAISSFLSTAFEWFGYAVVLFIAAPVSLSFLAFFAKAWGAPIPDAIAHYWFNALVAFAQLLGAH